MHELRAFDPKLCPDFQIYASLELKADLLSLRYRLLGPLDQLVIPQAQAVPQFQDELWKTSCFELFLQGKESNRYEEWNFSPSGHWAHYSFHSYRERNLEASPAALRKAIAVSFDSNSLELSVGITLNHAVEGSSPKGWNYSITSVLHTKKDERHYWALTHVGSKPDFHDARSFIGQLELRSS